ncbi:MAG: ABC transporter substrate-binding protein [Nitrospinota bacterium]|nr:ABC transporter substrate-binding protein [Nitrospinota bacterium]
MWVKRLLIFLPVFIILFLLQSFFWVPTYEKQTTGNPERLITYVHSSIADAEILNPILSADSASSSINNLVFEGLLDLDDQLNYRLRLAKKWTQHEEANLAIDPSFRINGSTLGGPEQWILFIKKSLASHPGWSENIRSIEIIPGKTIQGEVESPANEPNAYKAKEPQKSQKIPYVFQQPDRLRFTLKKIDQDFFDPIEKLLGEKYFSKFPYEKFIQPIDTAHQQLLRPHYGKILQVTEHNPVIIFDLRQGVYFHDGHEFDAGDVLFTYKAIMDPKNTSPRRSDYEPVKSSKVLGPYKIRFIYKRLFSPAINSWFMGILPEHLLNNQMLKTEAEQRNLSNKKKENFSIRDSRFNRNPIGTGPFVFKEWQADDKIRLIRNERYWEAPPQYHEYILRIIPDPLTQEMEFYAGAVDNYGVQPHQVARFKTEEKYQSFSSVGYFYSYIGYNMRNPLFQSAEVRQALGMAIDVDEIIEHILYGEGERVTGPYPKITDWYDPSVKPIPYDPKAALKILNRLGWKKNSQGWLEKDGRIFEFNLITNNGNPVRKNIMTIAQNSWKKLGIKCNTQLFEWAVFLKDFINSGKFDATVLGWSMGIDPDVYQIWHSSQSGPRQLNFVGYKDPEADRLIVRIRREYDKENQIKLTHKLHRIIARDQPYTFLYVAKATQLLDKKIVLVHRQEDGKETYQQIYPTKGGDIRFYFNKWRKLKMVPQVSSAGPGI